MTLAIAADCPLCGHATHPFHHRGIGSASPGDYRRCRHCGLIALERDTWPDPAMERAYYRTHENRPDDTAYIAHLERLVAPLTRSVPPPAAGLDWGCGPHPVLADCLRQQGYQMAAWDPAFGPVQPDAPAEGWDFITCTEVLEHLHTPRSSLVTMLAQLRPGGVLAIMTEWPPTAGMFHRWHYRRDPTHIAFYGPSTLRWIAEQLGCTVDLQTPDIALFNRLPAAAT